MPKTITRELLAAEYLDYVNNYVSVELFAEHRGLTTDEAIDLLQLCRRAHEDPHPDR